MGSQDTIIVCQFCKNLTRSNDLPQLSISPLRFVTFIMKIFRLIGAVILAFVLTIAASQLQWQLSSRSPSDTTPTIARLTLDSVRTLAQPTGCALESRVVRSQSVEVDLSRNCLEEKFKIDQLLSDLETQIQQRNQTPLEIGNIRYNLIDGGFRLAVDVEATAPVFGPITLQAYQNFDASIESGILNIEARETEIVGQGVPLGSLNLQESLKQLLDRVLLVYDDRSVSELMEQSGTNAQLAEQLGVDVEVVNFAVRSLQDDIDAIASENLLTLSVRIEED